MLKKLLVAGLFTCVLGSNVAFSSCERTHYESYAHPEEIKNGLKGLFVLSSILCGAATTYASHTLLNKNEYYREKIIPALKKISFFIQGSKLTDRALFPSNCPLTIIPSCIIAYKLNDLLNKNEFYKNEINPFIQKASLIALASRILSTIFINGAATMFDEIDSYYEFAKSRQTNSL